MAEFSGSRDLWRSVRICVKPGFEDIASAVIFESGFYGLLEESVSEKGTFFSAFYRVSKEQNDPLDSLMGNLEPYTTRLGENPIEIEETADIPFQDWEFSWRQGLAAVETGKRLVVRPSWVPYDNPDKRIEILIDPKMAFGTGGHGNYPAMP